jgi:hypothetical protein
MLYKLVGRVLYTQQLSGLVAGKEHGPELHLIFCTMPDIRRLRILNDVSFS